MLDLRDAQTCRRRALWPLGLYLRWQLGAGVCSDPAFGCRGSRTVGTWCVAFAWTRCGTSQRLSGSSASCPTAPMHTALAACAPGGRANRTSHQMSSSQCHEFSVREGNSPQAWGLACRLVTILPPPTTPRSIGPVPSAECTPATSSPTNSG